MAQTNEELQASDLNFQTPEGRKSFWLNIFSVWLGTTMEYVDFALYGLAAGLVFGDVFFPEQTPIIALLSSFATYAVGFLARPLGAIILGRVGDRHGRKVIMVITVGLMGVSTTALGLLPTYRQVGWLAPALLVFLRLCQGFGAGAELSGGAVMLAEFSPVKHRGVVASLIGVGSNTGTLLASSVWLLVLTMPKEQLMTWGWRIPFLISIFIAFFAIFLRRSMQESPVFTAFKERKKREQESVVEAGLDAHEGGWRAFFVMLGLRIGENGPSYIRPVLPRWLRRKGSGHGESRSDDRCSGRLVPRFCHHPLLRVALGSFRSPHHVPCLLRTPGSLRFPGLCSSAI